MARPAVIALAAFAMFGHACGARALADVGSSKSDGRHSAHYALGCRKPNDVVKVANHIQPAGCRPINLRWVKIDNYDIRIGTTEMIRVEHPFYGPVYVLRPQE